MIHVKSPTRAGPAVHKGHRRPQRLERQFAGAMQAPQARQTVAITAECRISWKSLVCLTRKQTLPMIFQHVFSGYVGGAERIPGGPKALPNNLSA